MRSTATAARGFWGRVTPVDVVDLQHALSNNPNRECVKKTVFRTEGGGSGCSSLNLFRFSKNLPTAALNPEVVASNLAEEVAKKGTAGPFLLPSIENHQVSRTHLSALSLKNIPTNSEYPICTSQTSKLQHKPLTIDNAILAIQRFGSDCFMAKTDMESTFRLFRVPPDDWELLAMFRRNGFYHFDKVLPFGLRSTPFTFNWLSDAMEWIYTTYSPRVRSLQVNLRPRP